MLRSLTFTAIALTAMSGCDGTLANVDDAGGAYGTSNQPGIDGADSQDSDRALRCSDVEPPAMGHIRRLTEREYANTLRAAFPDIDSLVVPQFEDANPTIGFGNDPSLLAINSVNVDPLYASAESNGGILVNEYQPLADCIAENGPDCFLAVIDTLTPTLWRRPATDDERQALLEKIEAIAQAGGSRVERGEFLAQALLLSTNMLYRSELADSVRGTLSSYDLASAMSYSFWSSPPDDELLRLAASDELQQPEVLQQQAERMSQDPRFAQTLTEFFVDLLKLDSLMSLDKASSLGLTPDVRRAMLDGARADLAAVLSDPSSTLLSAFERNPSWVEPLTAPFYGIAQVDEGSSLELPENERWGILTHPAFLSVHAGVEASGIVQRGVFTLEQLLCFKIPPPPDNVSGVAELPPDFDPDTASSREQFEIEHSGQPACAACHTVIDPAGFGFENYDSAGRYRTVEKATIPIDASGSIVLDDETLTFSDSVDYIQAIENSTTFRSCLSERLLTYILGESASLCERDTFREAIASGLSPIHDLPAAIVASPSFTARSSEGSNP